MPATAPSLAVFAAPGRYVQGRGAIETLASELERLNASKPLVLLDPAVRDVVGEAVDAVPGAVVLDFAGECSPGEIDRVAAHASEHSADAVVAVGGGKAMDTAKAVAHPAELPLVIVPTIASTDAPTSAVSVVYDDDGAFLEYRFWARNPHCVLVDTQVIAGARVVEDASASKKVESPSPMPATRKRTGAPAITCVSTRTQCGLRAQKRYSRKAPSSS